LQVSLFGRFDPKVVAMLAEIFMMRLEAERRLGQEVLPSSASRLIPFSPKSQFAFKKANHEEAEALSKEPLVRLVR
jgi:hypothetical protein